MRGQRHAPAALNTREKPGTRYSVGWLGLRPGLDRCGKSRPHRDSIPGPSSTLPVALPTTLPDPQIYGRTETNRLIDYTDSSINTLRISAVLRRLLTLILRRSRTGTVWFYTSTSNNRAARPKLYTKSLTRDLNRMYIRLTLVRISIKL